MSFRFPTSLNWRPTNIASKEQEKRQNSGTTKSGLWGKPLRLAFGPHPPPVFGHFGHGPGGGNAYQSNSRSTARTWGPESYVTPPRSDKALLNILRENNKISTTDDDMSGGLCSRRGEGVGMNGSSGGRIQPLMGSGRGGLERNGGIDMRGESKFNQDFSKVTGMGGGKNDTMDFSGKSSMRDFTGKSSMIDSGMGGMSSGFDLRATSSMNTMENGGFGSGYGIGGSYRSRPSGMGFSGMGTNSYPTGVQDQFKVPSKSKQLLMNEVKKRASETTHGTAKRKVMNHNGEGSGGGGKGSGVNRVKDTVVKERGDSSLLDDSFLVSSSLQKPHKEQYFQQETKSSAPSASPSASLPSRQQQTQSSRQETRSRTPSATFSPSTTPRPATPTDEASNRQARIEDVVIDRGDSSLLDNSFRVSSSPPRGQNSEFHIRNVRDSPDLPLTPDERDARTVFCMQLSQRCRARDVEEFFSSVGKVRDVKFIVCNKTRRFKGIAYVEFKDMESVPLAMGLSGQKLLGVPIIVQPSQAEKNRASNYFDPMTNETSMQTRYSQQETRSSTPSPSTTLRPVPSATPTKGASTRQVQGQQTQQLMQVQGQQIVLPGQQQGHVVQVQPGAAQQVLQGQQLMQVQGQQIVPGQQIVQADPGLECEVRVHGISDFMTELMIRKHFEKVGKILCVYVPKKKDGSRHLLYSTKEEAQKCITLLNGTEFRKRDITVSWARVKMCLRQDSEGYTYCKEHNICLNFNTHDRGCTTVGCKARHICRWCHELEEKTEPHGSRWDCPNKTEGYVNYAVSQD